MREFRELLEKDVAERIRKAKARNAEKLQEHEDKLQAKVDKERESLEDHYKNLRDQYEKSERQRQEVELGGVGLVDWSVEMELRGFAKLDA